MIFKDGVMEEIEEFDISNDIIITIKKGPSERRVWVYTGMPVRKIRIYDGNR